MTRADARWAMCAAAILLAVAALLRWTGLSWGEQALFAALLAAWVAAGDALLKRLAGGFPDRITAAAASLTLGLVLHTAFSFAAFHEPVLGLVPGGGTRAAAWLALTALLACAACGLGVRRREPGWQPWFASGRLAVLVLALASLVAVCSAFGYLNDLGRARPVPRDRPVLSAMAQAAREVFGASHPPSWGAPLDRDSHVMRRPAWIAEAGFPTGFAGGAGAAVEAQHVGVSTLIASLTMLGGDFSARRAIGLSKALSLLWIVLGTWWIAAIAGAVLGLSEGQALAAAAGVPLFAALNPALLRGAISSYGVAPLSGTLYHNITQQASVAVGFAGLFLVLRDLRRPAGAYLAGCALVGASLFFKPSCFGVVAPALIALALLPGEGRPRRGLLGGLALPGAAAALWFLYPRLVGLDVRGVDVVFRFLAWQRTYAVFPWPVRTPAALVASLLLLGYAACLPPLLWRATSAAAGLRRSGQAERRPESLLLALTFAVGLAGGVFLAEGGALATHGNFTWGFAVGHLAALPLLVRMIAGIGSAWLRRVGWALYAAQLASGAWNLLLFGAFGIVV